MSSEPKTQGDKANNQTLVLIDGHALAYRAYFALANTGFQTRQGEPTHAVYGFALMLMAVWDEYDPDYLAVTFDVGDTFRHKKYADYKATREKMPDDLRPQIGRIEQMVGAFNIPVFTAENFEADDVLGTLADQASQQDVETIIAIAAADEASANLSDAAVLSLQHSTGATGDLRGCFRCSQAIIGTPDKSGGSVVEALDPLRPVGVTTGSRVGEATGALRCTAKEVRGLTLLEGSRLRRSKVLEP